MLRFFKIKFCFCKKSFFLFKNLLLMLLINIIFSINNFYTHFKKLLEFHFINNCRALRISLQKGKNVYHQLKRAK
ncbi:UNVERIFIED_CONTAM: hypothetical protein NCL1_19703 [Trichonephila clavipes]